MSQAAPTRARRPNLKDEVAAHIREMILTAVIRPGQKINQDRVAEELGVSKLPVREALISLAAEGLVDNVARRGAFVASLTADDIHDHYAIYGRLCGIAAERAASVVSPETLEQLQNLVNEMVSTDDPRSLGQLNNDFHRTINRIGTSRRLRSLIRQLADSMPDRFYEYTEGWKSQALEDHQAIIDALRSRSPSRSAALVSKHLERSGDFAVSMLQQAGFWDSGIESDSTGSRPDGRS